MDHEGSIGHLENIDAFNSPQFLPRLSARQDIRYIHNDVSDGDVLLKSDNITAPMSLCSNQSLR